MLNACLRNINKMKSLKVAQMHGCVSDSVSVKTRKIVNFFLNASLPYSLEEWHDLH